MKAIIPAAGYATRLGELTKNKPKHLLDIGKVPMINYVISGIESLPVDQAFLVTNNKFYRQFLSWQEKLETRLEITILNDGTCSNKDRLGAVGDIYYGVKQAQIDDDLFIIAGDNLYYEKGKGCNLKPLYDTFQQLNGSAGVIGLYDVASLEIAKHMNQMTFADDKVPTVGEKSRIIKMVEKDPHPTTTLIAVLIEIYPKITIEFLREYIDTKDNHDKIGDFRSWLLEKRKIPIYGYHLPGQWFDIGLPQTLTQARRFYDKLID